MLRHALHFAFALVTCFAGVSLAGIWQAAPAPHAAPASDSMTYCSFGPTPPRERDEAEIREIVRQYDLAQTWRDASFFQRVEADTFVLTLSDGRTKTKAQAIADMLTWPEGDRYTTEVSDIRFHGDVAVVTGMMTVTRDGGESFYGGRWVDVFVRRDAGWQILSTTQAD
jgi:hypothetical protein